MSDEWFLRIEQPWGYPLALFRLRDYDLMTGDRERYVNREGLVSLIENYRKLGRPVGQYERALEALDAATEEWAKTPWDGR